MIAVPSKASRRKAMEAYNRGAAARQDRSRATVTEALTLLGLAEDPWLGVEELYAWERTEQANSIYYAEMGEAVREFNSHAGRHLVIHG